jgi:hypothetical protein
VFKAPSLAQELSHEQLAELPRKALPIKFLPRMRAPNAAAVEDDGTAVVSEATDSEHLVAMQPWHCGIHKLVITATSLAQRPSHEQAVGHPRPAMFLKYFGLSWP